MWPDLGKLTKVTKVKTDKPLPANPCHSRSRPEPNSEEKRDLKPPNMGPPFLLDHVKKVMAHSQLPVQTTKHENSHVVCVDWYRVLSGITNINRKVNLCDLAVIPNLFLAIKKFKGKKSDCNLASRSKRGNWFREKDCLEELAKETSGTKGSKQQPSVKLTRISSHVCW